MLPRNLDLNGPSNGQETPKKETKDEIAIMGGHREKGGWGYYELHVEEADDRAAVNVSFIAACEERMSILWIIDGQRRVAVRKAFNRFLDEDLFDD